MCKIRQSLGEMREERHITPAQAAAFIGVTTGSYWDLEMHNDEPWTLSVMEFMRLCVLYETAPENLLPEDTFLDGKKQVQFVQDEYGKTAIASVLRGCCEDISQTTQAINWEHDSIELWLSDEDVIGTMPLLALNDLCRHLDISVLIVLKGLWAALGHSSKT